jgi:hypothetical protein
MTGVPPAARLRSFTCRRAAAISLHVPVIGTFGLGRELQPAFLNSEDHSTVMATRKGARPDLGASKSIALTATAGALCFAAPRHRAYLATTR